MVDTLGWPDVPHGRTLVQNGVGTFTSDLSLELGACFDS